MKTKRLISLVFIFSFIALNILYAGGRDAATPINEKYLSARELFRKGEYEAAIKGFEEVIKMDPNYKVASEYLKMANERLQAKAERAKMKEILDANTAEREQHTKTNYAKMKEALQRWQDKEKEKDRIRQEKNKEMARIKRERELADYYGLNQLEEISKKTKEMIAKAEEKMALEENKEKSKLAMVESLSSPKKERALANIYIARGEAAYKDGNYDDAVKEWGKVLAVDSNNREAAGRIEHVRLMIEKNKQAELGKARQEAIAEARDAVNKYCDRGKYLYSHKDYKGSIEEFQKALAIDPNNKEVKDEISKARQNLTKKNIKEKAIYDERAKDISKLVAKGTAYMKENKFEKAKKYALEALEIDPNSGFAKRLLENAENALRKK